MTTLREVNDLEQQINAAHRQNIGLARRFGVTAQNTSAFSNRAFGSTLEHLGLIRAWELGGIEELKRSHRCQPDYEAPTPEALEKARREQEERRARQHGRGAKEHSHAGRAPRHEKQRAGSI